MLLHLATEGAADVDTIRLLLEAGVNVYGIDKNHETPLHVDKPEVIKLLIEAGVDVYARTSGAQLRWKISIDLYLNRPILHL